MSKHSGKFFLAGLLGAIGGALGGLLLAPKSGEETRKQITKIAREIAKDIKMEGEETESRVRQVFGNAGKKARIKYKKIRRAVIAKVAEVKNAGEAVDKEKYAKVVDEIVKEFGDDFKATKSGAVKMAALLKKDWERIKKALS